MIPIDSIFSPVRRVAYSVEQARVGQRTDFDKLTLDIETDGSIDPQAALREAAEILISSLSIFTDEDRIEELRAGPGGMTALDNGAGGGAGALVGVGGRPGGGPMDDILIEELELGVRSYNCLKRAGIQTVGDLIGKSEGELAAIPNFGKKSIDEVVETLLPARPEPPHRLGVEAPCATRRPATSCRATPRTASRCWPTCASRSSTTSGSRRREAKAKAVKPELEKLITLARKGDLHARRQAISILQHPDKGVIYKLFEEIAPRYAERPGGYTRILKLGPRPSDATEMVYLELV